MPGRRELCGEENNRKLDDYRKSPYTYGNVLTAVIDSGCARISAYAEFAHSLFPRSGNMTLQASGQIAAMIS